jgi:hypothetical protein
VGLAEHYVSAEVGTSLYELGRDPDSRAVSLTILVRLSRLLEVPLDDLVTTDDPHVHPPGELEPPAGQVGDDHVLLGLIATYNKLGVLRVLNLLGWTRTRLDTALTAIAEHLAPTALRVVATTDGTDTTEVEIHPDVLFALGLADAPAAMGT